MSSFSDISLVLKFILIKLKLKKKKIKCMKKSMKDIVMNQAKSMGLAKNSFKMAIGMKETLK